MPYHTYYEDQNSTSIGQPFKEGYVNTDTGDWASGSDILIERTKKEITNQDIQNELKTVKQDISNKNTSLLTTQDIDEKTIWVKNKFTTETRKDINNLTLYRDKLSLKYEIASRLDTIPKLSDGFAKLGY